MLSRDFPWGPILIIWITIMAVMVIYYTQPEGATYIQFDNGPAQQITPNTQPPWEA